MRKRGRAAGLAFVVLLLLLLMRRLGGVGGAASFALNPGPASATTASPGNQCVNCGHSHPPAAAPPAGPRAAEPDAGVPRAENPSRVFALLVNGGGTPRENYRSHLEQVRRLLGLLHASNVPDGHVTVLASDGDDPAPDLATRLADDGRQWLLEGTSVEQRLALPVVMRSSTLEGTRLFPATRAALAIWFLTAGAALRPGDTLLLYVTDHGTRGTKPADNRIRLWGDGEAISVGELAPWLGRLPSGVRVVMLMSQCFSGGFASLVTAEAGEARPAASLCGFYSTTADRPAYGCYPEIRERDDVGYSFAFFEAMGAGRSFSEAHADTLVRDHTPDVPVRTSDLYLQGRLEALAQARHVTVSALADVMWVSAPRPEAAAADELLQKLERSFGFTGVETMAATESQAVNWADAGRRLGAAAADTTRLMAEANRTALSGFEAARPGWIARLADGTSKLGLDEDRLALHRSLLLDLEGHAMSDPGWPSQRDLHVRLTALRAAAYRMEVRQAVLLRVRIRLAAEAMAAEILANGSAGERETLDRLAACEDWSLPGAGGPRSDVPPVTPFPPVEEDLALAQSASTVSGPPVGAGAPGPRSALPNRSPAPALAVQAYRGAIPSRLDDGTPRLLFFWATYCAPCKAAIPAVLALGREHHVQVIAITSEDRATVDAFFSRFASPFPDLVALDPQRVTSARYAVDAVPLFVLIDEEGIIRSTTVGFQSGARLGLGAWLDGPP